MSNSNDNVLLIITTFRNQDEVSASGSNVNNLIPNTLVGQTEVSFAGNNVNNIIVNPSQSANITVTPYITTTNLIATTEKTTVLVGTPLGPSISGPRGNTGATGPTGSTGQGIPTGGFAGQVLAKIDSTNYNTQWVTNNLDNLSDVVITSATNNQAVIYDSSTSLWKNQSITSVVGLAYKSGVPASKTATGTLGELAIDGANGVLYICTGTNTWQKVSLNSANFTNAGGFT